MSKLLPSSKRQSGRRHWTLARRRPQSLLISSSLLCGRHLLQRGGRSCPSQARPAPITPLEATGACPWLGWSGPLAGQEPAQGSILTNIYTCGMQVSTPLWSWYLPGTLSTVTRCGPPATQSAIDAGHLAAAVARRHDWRSSRGRKG
ncbi:hypothetical protein HDV63DRAFT_151360 [Trichoderma sp. SZMC 28014]